MAADFCNGFFATDLWQRIYGSGFLQRMMATDLWQRIYQADRKQSRYAKSRRVGISNRLEINYLQN